MSLQRMRYPADRLPRPLSELSEMEEGTGTAESCGKGRKAGAQQEHEAACLAEDDGEIVWIRGG